MEELAGFVNGSVNRRKVLEILESKGATEPKRVAKIARLIPSATNKILQELEENGLVQKTADGKVELSADGKIIIDYTRAL
ncbi:hypothetical protein MmiEs2_02980 [Methanimicrococcus stummii]|uniref:Uncharacterized protein n=1 Tax=Methanimicrococcus stummii TaxID=3028294 RepID=A0AA96ZXU3_9EURY|nr:winged helix-turn-helix transcriptional regulator [Methanimicrococcus sp. Es2]WNY28116.1 hypothetical protein MmiEs2_02980 [Methanimicrococcus sp. Es2]